MKREKARYTLEGKSDKSEEIKRKRARNRKGGKMIKRGKNNKTRPCAWLKEVAVTGPTDQGTLESKDQRINGLPDPRTNV